MALRLVKAGYGVTVHNRTRERELPLEREGAYRADTPRAAAESADVVITMVSDTPDLEQVVLGENGVIHGMEPGNLLIDMSTVSPAVTRDIAERVENMGAAMLDAPVSGGSEGAEKGTLSIMVGGSEAHLERARPLLEQLGKTVTLVGPVGSGQLVKAMNQVIIAGTYTAVAEGIALGLKAGIDIEAAHAAVSGGAAGSWGLINRGPNMIRNDYPLGFRTRLHRKDLGIALEAARELGVPIPLAAYVEQLETSLVAKGFGDEDVSNIARVVRQQAGLD